MPKINAPVGKSGPFTILSNSESSHKGLSIKKFTASQISAGLCGGIFVAIPTAIPEPPFINKLGNLAGRTTGSFKDPSKFSSKSTVSSCKLANISSAIGLNLASVYLIAAGGSLSTLP